MKKVGFLGCGKIGKKMLEHVLNEGVHSVAFVQDPSYSTGDKRFPVIREADAGLLSETDLVVEAATADVLKENIDEILKYCDLMLFSVTAFSDEAFYQHAKELMMQYGRKVYLPHGAILGIDGIIAARELVQEISIETVKSPGSLCYMRDRREKRVSCFQEM